jgi:excinuclease Cho
MTQYHIVNNWLWLGAVDDINDAATLLRTPAGFRPRWLQNSL